MSPLTKLFVILLVVLSLLMTAATVVYVNKEDIQHKSLKDVAAERDRMMQTNQNLQATSTAMQQNLQNVTQQAQQQAAAKDSEILRLQNDMGKQGVDLAKLTSQVATQQLEVGRLTEALQATQTGALKQGDEVVRLRGDNDKLVTQSSDLNGRVSDLTNKLDMTEKERRLLAEQLTQMKGENQRMSAIINSARLSPEQQQAYMNRSGQPSIKGVVRDVRQIAGNQYATINVGSADDVTRGMEFKVVDRQTGDFLGTLVVDTVEPNESIGRLSGPRVAAIRPGVEVRTQL